MKYAHPMFYTRHVHFRGRRDIFIISYALIVGWKINLVLLKFSFTIYANLTVYNATYIPLIACAQPSANNCDDHSRQSRVQLQQSNNWCNHITILAIRFLYHAWCHVISKQYLCYSWIIFDSHEKLYEIGTSVSNKCVVMSCIKAGPLRVSL